MKEVNKEVFKPLFEERKSKVEETGGRLSTVFSKVARIYLDGEKQPMRDFAFNMDGLSSLDAFLNGRLC